MKVAIQQTHHTIADFGAIFETIKNTVLESKEESLHVFPELFLTGYPLQDLCLQRSFIDEYLNFLNELQQWSIKLDTKNICLLLGGIKYSFENDADNIPHKLENVVYKLIPGQKLEAIYTKILLPNYDIFDEKKYFTRGTKPTVFEFQNKKIGVLICEDMWHSSVHQLNPVEDLLSLNIKMDLVVNLSASPFNLYKKEKRFERACEISKKAQAPFVYVNRVGVEDEIIFDGNSFIVNGDFIEKSCKSFESDIYITEAPSYNGDFFDPNQKVENTWEGLFSPNLTSKQNDKLPTLKPFDDKLCQEIINALCFGVQEYAGKSGFKKFLIALSGGIDSALVLALLKISLKEGQSLEAIYMPSKFSRQLSQKVSQEMCEKAEIPLHVIPIQEAHQFCHNIFQTHLNEELNGLADENIQSRLRSLLLFARSNQNNSLVINTSNKSELAVGYSTIYGDSVGALSLLGDLYKSEVYELSRYINKKYNNLIPDEIISRAPSAELREDQVDTDSLPPYERMDAILEGILSYRLSGKQLVKLGFDKNEVESVLNLYRRTEYKRTQFCPILKLKSKSFGYGYRVPLCINSDYYMKL